MEKPPWAYANLQDLEVLPNKVAGPGEQRYKKVICRQHIVLVPRTPGMHSGRGAAAIQSSCSFFCCSDMRTEPKRGEYWQKSNPVVEPVGESYYSGKESRLQGMTSQQSRIFLALAVCRGVQIRSPHWEKSTKFNLERISGINIFQLRASQQSVLENHLASLRQNAFAIFIKNQNGVLLSNENNVA